MSREQNKSVARRFFEAFEANDQATLKELLAADFVAYLPGAYEPMNRQEFLRNVIGAGNFRENWREKCQKLS